MARKVHYEYLDERCRPSYRRTACGSSPQAPESRTRDLRDVTCLQCRCTDKFRGLMEPHRGPAGE